MIAMAFSLHICSICSKGRIKTAGDYQDGEKENQFRLIKRQVVRKRVKTKKGTKILRIFTFLCCWQKWNVNKHSYWMRYTFLGCKNFVVNLANWLIYGWTFLTDISRELGHWIDTWIRTGLEVEKKSKKSWTIHLFVLFLFSMQRIHCS